MAGKLNYSSESLLDLTFTKNVRGYDPLQVDVALDKVIIDYRYYEKFFHEAKPYIGELEQKITKLSDEIRDKDIEIAKLNNRLSNIKDNPNVSQENIDLLGRINVLEKALYARGIDPSKIK